MTVNESSCSAAHETKEKDDDDFIFTEAELDSLHLKQYPLIKHPFTRFNTIIPSATAECCKNELEWLEGPG